MDRLHHGGKKKKNLLSAICMVPKARKRPQREFDIQWPREYYPIKKAFLCTTEKKRNKPVEHTQPGGRGGGGGKGAEKPGQRWCKYTYKEYWVASTNSDISSVSASNSAEGGDMVSLAQMLTICKTGF